jgi:hypothetical protein
MQYQNIEVPVRNTFIELANEFGADPKYLARLACQFFEDYGPREIRFVGRRGVRIARRTTHDRLSAYLAERSKQATNQSDGSIKRVKGARMNA